METNELKVVNEGLENYEVTTTELPPESRKVSPGQIVVGVGLLTLAGVGLYKLVAKPIVKFVKSRKAKKKQTVTHEITPNVKDVFDEEKFGDETDKFAE